MGDRFKSWGEVTPESARELIAALIKAEMWEVLAIIGMAQLLILPAIASKATTAEDLADATRTRIIAALGR